MEEPQAQRRIPVRAAGLPGCVPADARGEVRGLLQKPGVAVNIRKHKSKLSALPYTEEISRAPELKVFLRDIKAVRRLFENGQSLRLLFYLTSIEKNTVRLRAASADASAELMKLGQAETLRILHHHHRGIRHVDADLDDGRGHKNINLVRGKAVHDVFFLRRLHSPMQGFDGDVIGHRLF